VRLMSLMLGIVIATHSISDYQVLHANAGGAAGTPSVLLDMNVPCAMLLAGLAARRLGRMATAAAGSAGRGAPSSPTRSSRRSAPCWSIPGAATASPP